MSPSPEDPLDKRREGYRHLYNRMKDDLDNLFTETQWCVKCNSNCKCFPAASSAPLVRGASCYNV
eukprot:10672056-Lingulodinium_polyedra.AAC.1